MKISSQAVQSLINTATIDCGAYGHLIKHFTDHHLPFHSLQLHARIVLYSVTPDNFLASKLISFYSKQNRLSQARHLFDNITQKNTFSYNALLIAYCSHEFYTGALSFFSSWARTGFLKTRPDAISVSCLLKALSGLGYVTCSLTREVHGFVLCGGLDFDVFVGNGLVTCYSKCDDAVCARKVFDEMRDRDVVSWNSMIAGYSQCGFYEECKGLYREMNCRGLKPNVATLVSVLQACWQSKDLLFGMDVHKNIIENQINVDISVCNALIAFYAKCGSLDYARALFDEISDKDSITYGAIISGYMNHGFVDEALKIFGEIEHRELSVWNAVISGLGRNDRHERIVDLVHEMQESGVRPMTMTLSSILPTFSYYLNLKGAKEIHAYAVRNSFDDDIYVATTIVDTYAKLGFLDGAQRVFYQSKYRSLVIWTAIISGYAAHGDAHSALTLFDQMQNSGIKPDSVTFTAVLSACAHSGEVDKAKAIFNSMLVEHSVKPSVEQYACMVGVLSRAAKLDEAKDFISKMPIEPSAKVWGALLNGASVCGDVELGKFVSERLFEMEPDNTGNYIIMANLYSQAGRWDEADMVRKKMGNIGLKKVAGNSWVETSSGLQKFIAKDTSNERTVEIYAMLEALLGLMREEGYIMKDEFDEESMIA